MLMRPGRRRCARSSDRRFSSEGSAARPGPMCGLPCVSWMTSCAVTSARPELLVWNSRAIDARGRFERLVSSSVAGWRSGVVIELMPNRGVGIIQTFATLQKSSLNKNDGEAEKRSAWEEPGQLAWPAAQLRHSASASGPIVSDCLDRLLDQK